MRFKAVVVIAAASLFAYSLVTSSELQEQNAQMLNMARSLKSGCR
jgi:hypothetical protein